MVFRFFQDENKAQGITGSQVQAGISNADDGRIIEKGITLPWLFNPRYSWMAYQCWIECHLDSGMVLHKPLPQSNPEPDTLASGFVSPLDNDFESNVAGVNLKSTGNYTDVVQRMANSDYRFVLKGYGMRAGYQIPIPGLKSVGGVDAVPDERQFGQNTIVGNCSGIPIWYAEWDLWYFVNLPPTKAQVPPPNVALHIAGDQQLSPTIQAPYSQPDGNAVAAIPQTNLGPAVVPKP
jgi:hypothetical protein